LRQIEYKGNFACAYCVVSMSRQIRRTVRVSALASADARPFSTKLPKSRVVVAGDASVIVA
jgi:hypothetical protein